MLSFVKGDASKTGSEIGSVARSMEEVNGSKKDLSTSTGEAWKLPPHTLFMSKFK